MDYTTLLLVKDEIHGLTTGRDALITRLVTAVSRRTDRYCAGTNEVDSDNYFQLADVANEVLYCNVQQFEKLLIFPHKPRIVSVSSIMWRGRPDQSWNTVAANQIEVHSPRVYAYIGGSEWDVPESVMVKISYRGGFGAAQTDLPADLVQHVTVWAARAFKEAATGLTDQIGMDELGIISYVKAIPSTVADGLQPYRRVVLW